MDHIVIFCKLAHTLAHSFAVAVASQTNQRLHRVNLGLLFSLIGFDWQVITQKVILFHCERIDAVILFVFIIFSQYSSLMFCASHASNTFFVAHCIRNVLTQIFQGLILTSVFEFLGGLDNARRFWKQAKLLDTLLNDGLVSKVPCMIYPCREGL